MQNECGPVSGKGRCVDIGLEADHGLVAKLQHRALDHRRLGEHQFDGTGLVDVGLLFVGKLAEGGTGLVQHDLPAVLVAPAGQVLAVDASGLVVMEGVLHLVLVEPGAGLLHRVAGFDAVEIISH